MAQAPATKRDRPRCRGCRAECDPGDCTHLAGRLLDATEHERQRFGRDLHDSLGQQLTGISLLAGALAQRLRDAGSAHAAAAQDVAALAREAIAQAKGLTRELSPYPAGPATLPVALADLAAATTHVFGIRCTLKGPVAKLSPALDAQAGLHLYRIAQEAVHNAVRHARATRIDISLTRQAGRLVLQVDDDGAGIDRSKAGDGMGLRTMAWRARAIAGVLKITTRHGGGVRVRCVIPLGTTE